jgi:hypothetical protein
LSTLRRRKKKKAGFALSLSLFADWQHWERREKATAR